MIFSNKADTLANLNKLGLKNSVIPRFVSFSVKEWKNGQKHGTWFWYKSNGSEEKRKSY